MEHFGHVAAISAWSLKLTQIGVQLAVEWCDYAGQWSLELSRSGSRGDWCGLKTGEHSAFVVSRNWVSVGSGLRKRSMERTTERSNAD